MSDLYKIIYIKAFFRLNFLFFSTQVHDIHRDIWLDRKNRCDARVQTMHMSAITRAPCGNLIRLDPRIPFDKFGESSYGLLHP